MGNTNFASFFTWRRIAVLLCIGLVLVVAAIIVKQRLRVVGLKEKVVALKEETWPLAWRDLGQLEIRELLPLTPELAKAFDRKAFPAEVLTSIDAFHSWADFGVPAAAAWHIPDSRMSKAAYYAALAGTLFAYGNRDHPDKVGCARTNELLPGPIEGCMTEAAFLGSRIGCCIDYALLMKELLDRSGLPNRLVIGKGHVFNEVTSEPPFIVDANTGILADASWEAIRNRGKFTVYQLPLAWASTKSDREYRPILARFRVVFLKTLATGGYQASYGNKRAICLMNQ